MTAARRIQKELTDLNRTPIPGVKISYDEENIMMWNCQIAGPADSPYKGGTFKFTMEFPTTFPFKAPTVTFLTKMYHPGINQEGHICLPMLRDEWKPSVSITTILTTILEKVGNPSPDDPYEPEIGAELRDDKTKFTTKAKEWTKKYAI